MTPDKRARSRAQLGEIDVTIKQAIAGVSVIVTTMVAAGGCAAWLHAELVVPSILQQARDDVNAKAAAILRVHSEHPHVGAVTDKEFQLVLEAIRKMETSFDRRLTQIEAAVAER